MSWVNILGGNVWGEMSGYVLGECPREKCPRPTGDFRYGRATEMKKMRLVDEGWQNKRIVHGNEKGFG